MQVGDAKNCAGQHRPLTVNSQVSGHNCPRRDQGLMFAAALDV
jgi:hypothetical protein